MAAGHTTGRPPTTAGRGHTVWTAKRDAELLRLHAEGFGCNQIARIMDLGSTTIHERAVTHHGLSFDRSQVEAANVARRADGRAKRLQLIEACYEEAFEVLAHRRTARTGNYKRVFKGEYGSEVTDREIDFVPPSEWRDLSATLGQFLNTAARLEAIDSDAGLTSARSMLGALAEAIGLKPTDDA